jgi:hypothetical protein
VTRGQTAGGENGPKGERDGKAWHRFHKTFCSTIGRL